MIQDQYPTIFDVYTVYAYASFFKRLTLNTYGGRDICSQAFTHAYTIEPNSCFSTIKI